MKLASLMFRALPLLALLLGDAPARAAVEPPAASVPSNRNTPAADLLRRLAVNDRQIEERLAAAGAKWRDEGRATKAADLIAQLKRTHCTLRLPSAPVETLSAADISSRRRAGILVVGNLFKCTECPRWHSGNASGFMLTDDGVFATCYHVVSQTNYAVMTVMTGDGRLAPVKEVLAASRRADVALLRADGAGFATVPLGDTAPVGARVWVLSHPDDRYYTLTEGLVSRYFLTRPGRRAREAVLMDITADFARGSSGAPVFDEHGAVTGIVTSTESIYYDAARNRRNDLQMVMKHCVPVQHLRDLIRAP